MSNLERMETFITLAECHSFSEAAKRLYCSQSTISHHIRQLEEYFETQLFHRLGKTIRMTKQGEVLLQYARQIVNLWREASVEVKHALPQKRSMSIYMSQYLAVHFFSTISEPFHECFPQYDLEINAFGYDDLKTLLQDGRIHFALMPIYPKDEYIMRNFEITPLFTDEFELIIPAGHPWGQRKMIYARDLSGSTILLPRSRFLQHCIRESLDRSRVKAGYLQMSNFDVIKKAVQSGYGIAFLPQGSVKKEIALGELATAPLPSVRIRRTNGFVLRKGASLSPLELKFYENLRQHFAKSTASATK